MVSAVDPLLTPYGHFGGWTLRYQYFAAGAQCILCRSFHVDHGSRAHKRPSRITHHELTLESMSLTWLLPVVTLVVGASTGGIIAQALTRYSPNAALLTVIFSACIVIIGLALTMMLLTVYLIRTIVYGYAKGPGILSIFFPLGPAGQGAYAILLIGSVFKSILPLMRAKADADGWLWAPGTGEMINVICVVVAFVLWSFGTMWVISAFLGLWYSLRRTHVPFRLTFWSMIFPNVRLYFPKGDGLRLMV